MSSIPQDGEYRADPIIREISDFLADPVKAANFPETRLRFRNDHWAKSVGLAGLSDEAWCRHFGRFEALPGNLEQPLALRYHGHQFRNYNPEIGDGRGFLFAQLRDGAGRVLDLGTKGSGQTPYSRFGDGRLTLKGAVREILATEMLEALGVETSKTFSVIETGEALERNDEPSPTRAAVLVRLNHSHIRIGSFQRLAALQELDSLKRLVAYVLKYYYNEDDGGDAPARLLWLVVEQTAKLAAQFMAAGFVHGVLNSDNINITGESFDYGPWRWAPHFDHGFTAAYFDESGLYSYGRQPEAIHWDVVQLANALLPLSNEDALIAGIDRFAPSYYEALGHAMMQRLGVKSKGLEADKALITDLFASGVAIDRFFFDWRGGTRRGSSPRDADYGNAAFAPVARALAQYEPEAASLDHAYWQGEGPCSMLIDEVEAIWAGIAKDDDWSALHAKVAVVRRMGEAHHSK